MNYFRRKVGRLLRGTDIRINGNRPWDIRVHGKRFFRRVLGGASLALGETYMEGLWDCDALDEMTTRLLRSGLDRRVRSFALALDMVVAKVVNLQNPRRAFAIGKKHYDIGNDLYRKMLDGRMIYSCGYWRNAESLDEAQEAKLALIGRKLGLERGMRVLDIGCGWGGTAEYLARRYGCEVVGITVSQRQVEYAQAHTSDLPVEIRYQDYRKISERFDRVVSVGMFEHVGARNYATFMRKTRELLNPDGMMLLQTIGGNRSVHHGDPWMSRYIFPNSMLPSIRQIAAASEDYYVMEDWHNFGTDYDRTLLEWVANFDGAWEELADTYDERFRRMWRYYLLTSAAGFRARKNQVWQIVFTPRGVDGGYVSLR
jgi:cyclopropane-fatty-acyl-phospholipid synthase